MITYLDRVRYLYPDIQRAMYWQTQYDGKEWDDPYDGLVWDNPDIRKPSKETLDALNENVIIAELQKREEAAHKAQVSKDTPLDQIDTSVLDIKDKISSTNEIIKNNHEQIAKYITTNNTQINDIQNAFQAVKGYLLLIPELQKQLTEIKQLLEGITTK
jgi:predicted  nucleic acid-binding Zn-ribbon protein